MRIEEISVRESLVATPAVLLWACVNPVKMLSGPRKSVSASYKSTDLKMQLAQFIHSVTKNARGRLPEYFANMNAKQEIM
jgi:hypothetical protein